MKIGIDVGGSHIGLGIIDKDGKIICKKEKDYVFCKGDMSDIIIDTIVQLIKETVKENKINIDEIELFGIAVPGTVSKGIISKAENLGIQNLDIEKELKKEFDIPVYLQNDAKCAAIAEKEFGSLKKYDDAVFLIVGTGVGGAVFLDGKLLKPKRYSGFEVGHMVIGTDGIRCNCGRRGCFETYGSIKRFKKKLQTEFKLSDTDGKKIKEFMLENKGNVRMNGIIDEYIDNLSIGIINLINIFEPQAVSLGGSFAHYEDIFLRQTKKKNIRKGRII